MEFLSAGDYALGRLLFERSLAALYLVAFVSALNQFPALLGANGLLPVPDFLARGTSFWARPTLFHWGYTDCRFRVVAWAGILLSAAVLLGALAPAPLGAGLATWLALWFLYLSIVNVGQRFYSFGWESMLVEAGFFAAFLSPEWMEPSWIPVVLLRWMLFRVEVGAGLIKLRAGGPWLDLTALEYHHETQPMPNPLSRPVHRLPRPILRFGVLFSHFVQVAAPFGLFLPQPVAGIAAGLIILHQLLLIVAGNYAWLNWLTIVLALVALPDAWLSGLPGLASPEGLAPRPPAWDVVHAALLGFAVWLSVKPALNLLSKRQLMNCCFNAWHLVNAYGAFGSVTTERYEIVVEGAASERPCEADWRPYEFKGKPGDPRRVPPQVAPYHLRLDWLMWFLPLAAVVTSRGVALPGYEGWFLRFAEKLLEDDRATLRLLRKNPFPDDPPRRLRARFFLYRFSTGAEKRETGNVWTRRLVGEYLPPVSLGELKQE